MRDRSWSRMRRRVRMAAGFASGRELRDLHARVIRIINVQPTFTVAPNSRAGNLLRSILANSLRSSLDFRYAEGKMILRAKRFVIGGRRNVQHVLNPIVTVRNLQLVPINPLVLPAPLPRQLQAQPIALEPDFSTYA